MCKRWSSEKILIELPNLDITNNNIHYKLNKVAYINYTEISYLYIIIQTP